MIKETRGLTNMELFKLYLNDELKDKLESEERDISLSGANTTITS